MATEPVNPPENRHDTVLPLPLEVSASAWAVDAACSGNPVTHLSFTGTVSFVDGNRMVVTVPDAAPIADVLASTDPVGVQLSFDETSYKMMFEALDRVIKAKGNRLSYLRDLFYTPSMKAQRFTFSQLRFPYLNKMQEHAVNEVLCAKDVSKPFPMRHVPTGTVPTIMCST